MLTARLQCSGHIQRGLLVRARSILDIVQNMCENMLNLLKCVPDCTCTNCHMLQCTPYVKNNCQSYLTKFWHYRKLWILAKFTHVLLATSKIHRVSKNSQNCFSHNFVKFLLTLITVGMLMLRRRNYVRCTHFPPHVIDVNALPCET